MRDGAVLILVFYQHHFLFGIAHQTGLLARHHHVVDPDRNPGARRVQEAKRLDFVQHMHGDVQPKPQVAVLDHLRQALFLEQTVDIRHVLRQVVVEDHAADRGIHILLHELDGLGVQDVLGVERVHEVDDPAGVTQLDRAEGFDFTHFEGDQDVVGGREGAALALGAGLALGQVVHAKHHVLRGHGDGLA